MRPTVDDLRELFRLDTETGELFWRRRSARWFAEGNQTAERNAARWNARHAGQRALTALDSHGYRCGDILGRKTLAHRVVFAIANGHWPSAQVDHIDGNPTNNRPNNLREATRQQNGRNAGSRGGTSKHKGVRWHSGDRKWHAQCQDANGKQRHLGSFDDETEAARAYDRAAAEWHGDFAKLNFEDYRAPKIAGLLP